MLVLTQKEGEVLQVGDNVKIYIKRVKGNWVRLCIDAPREVTLLRIPVERATRPEGATAATDAPEAGHAGRAAIEDPRGPRRPNGQAGPREVGSHEVRASYPFEP